jgi:hypothetical protein
MQSGYDLGIRRAEHGSRTSAAPAAAVAALLVVALLALVRAEAAAGVTGIVGHACESQVFKDWADNGRVDGAYPLSCYRAAIAGLPADVRDYSDAPTEIERALAVAANRGTQHRAAATARDRPAASRAPVALIALGATGVLLAAAATAAPVARRRRRAGR